MILTQESLDSAEGKHMLQYTWFHPNRIAYHMYRFFHALLMNPQQSSALKQAIANEKQSRNGSLKIFQYLYELLLLKYAFPYSRLLGIYTMHYMQSVRSLHFVSEDDVLSLGEDESNLVQSNPSRMIGGRRTAQSLPTGNQDRPRRRTGVAAIQGSK